MAEALAVAKVLGLPGLVVAVWFLLERARIRANGEAEKAKAHAEEAKANAVAEGFRSLSAQITAHQTADMQSHAEMAEALAGVAMGMGRVEARQEAAEARHDRTGRMRLVTTEGEH